MMYDDEKKAKNILRNLYKDNYSDILTREDILKKITPKTWYNYSPTIQRHKLVTTMLDEGVGQKILAIKLTDKGRDALKRSKTNGSKNADTPPIIDGSAYLADSVLNLDAVGEFMYRFNSRSRYWELRLIRKEVNDKG